jgi:hypothetical protein
VWLGNAVQSFQRAKCMPTDALACSMQISLNWVANACFVTQVADVVGRYAQLHQLAPLRDILLDIPHLISPLSLADRPIAM